MDRIRTRGRGQGLVEFALILPVLLLIILGIIETAFVIQGYIAVQHAAREAARFAVSYQPAQGACMDIDGDGHIADGIGTDDDPDDIAAAAYPECPSAGGPDALESDEHYWDRRVLLIKKAARQAAAGLRVDDDHLGDTPERFVAYQDDPGFFGVRIWGYPGWPGEGYDCNADPGVCEDHPGLEGLPVRVVVAHNVEIVDPLYRVIVEYVPVRAESQMINEGVQVGHAEKPVPAASDPFPELGEPPVDTGGGGGGESGGGSGPSPLEYYTVELSPEQATNVLPNRGHEYVATVRNDLDQPVAGAIVSFAIRDSDDGGFSYSGPGVRYALAATNAQGRALVTLYGNRVGTAHLTAWLDFDYNRIRDTNEPYDEALKEWVSGGLPYIFVSDYDVVVAETIQVQVLDHHPISNAHRLQWCTISGTVPSQVMVSSFGVDSGGDYGPIGFTIPASSEGWYWVETETVANSDGCGGNYVARSDDIRVRGAMPDLRVTSITVPDTICPRTQFTVSAVIQNVQPVAVSQVFDVDFYVDPPFGEPHAPVGQMKQWVNGIGAGQSVVVNAVLWVGDVDQHDIWVVVDTSNFVDEGGGSQEQNNDLSTTVTPGTVTRTTDWFNPSANYVFESGGLGNATRAYGNEGGYAYRNNYANGVGHVYRNYGLPGPLPAYAVVEGIEVRLDWAIDNYYSTSWIEVYLSKTGGDAWTDNRNATVESWDLDVVGGGTDLWGEDEWSLYDLADGNFQVRLRLRTDSQYRDFYVDWVPVRVTYLSAPDVCGACDDPLPWAADKPPGLVECENLLNKGGFEGSYDDIFSSSAWVHVDAQHGSMYHYDGSYSLLLQDSLGQHGYGSAGPTGDCASFSPSLYQTVQVPSEVYSITTMVVRGQALVGSVPESPGWCPAIGSTDVDDVIYLQMEDGGGGDVGSAIEIINGGAAFESWNGFEEDVTEAVGLLGRAGQNMRVHFYGEHDQDTQGTWFSLDALDCEVCTSWPVPDIDENKATFGGRVRVLSAGSSRPQGVRVWAFRQGEAFVTYTIQDGTYTFYNMEPGTYTLYTEMWIGNEFHYTTRTVPVSAGTNDSDVHLYMW